MQDQHLSNVEQAKQLLAERIYIYTESQVDDWKKIPYLALRAEWRVAKGFGARLRRAYEYGVWTIRSQHSDNSNIAHVDCSTGALLASWGDMPASDALAIKLCHMPCEWEAKAVVQMLRELGRKPIHPDYDAQAYGEHVACATEEFDITRIYTERARGAALQRWRDSLKKSRR